MIRWIPDKMASALRPFCYTARSTLSAPEGFRDLQHPVISPVGSMPGPELHGMMLLTDAAQAPELPELPLPVSCSCEDGQTVIRVQIGGDAQ